MKSSAKKALTLKNLTKNNVWDVQENDIFRMCEDVERDADLRENFRRYVDIMKGAFIIEEMPDSSKVMRKKYEKQGYKVGAVKFDEDTDKMWAVKKRPIVRVSDLTYENIHHISAAKLIEVLERNFGGGWDSLSQSVKDIIESGFDISTTTLPQNRLHKPGGMYEKKVNDGYEVLEVPKGTWVEAIFAKLKPEMVKPKVAFPAEQLAGDEEGEIEDNYNKPDDDDIEPEEPADFTEEDITEDNYRTTFAIESDPDEEAEELSEYAEEQ